MVSGLIRVFSVKKPLKTVAHFLKEQVQSSTLIHPFCGEGGMLALANSLGLNAIGIERSPRRSSRARRQQLTENGKGWLLNSHEEEEENIKSED